MKKNIITLIVIFLSVFKLHSQENNDLNKIDWDNVTYYTYNDKEEDSIKKFYSNLINFSLGDTIILKNVIFYDSRSTLISNSYRSLSYLTDFLEENDDIHILILCHTYRKLFRNKDNIDTDTDSRKLTYNRGKTIYNYLIKCGIEENRVKFKGLKGEFSKHFRYNYINPTKVTYLGSANETIHMIITKKNN